MGRKKAITKKSEIANFRIMPEKKKILEEFAKQRGMNLSDFIRMVIEKYIAETQEETRLLNELKESPFKGVVEAFELISDGWGLGTHYIDAAKVLKIFFRANQEIFEDFPPSDPDLIMKLFETGPEIYHKMDTTRKDVLRKYLVFHAWRFNWEKEIKKRQEMEAAVMDLMKHKELEKELNAIASEIQFPEEKDKHKSNEKKGGNDL